jgi:hypothetical protein
MAIPLARQNFLSPDSQCYSFDERANGYSRGEGVGVVVLKRLSKALRDGDTIRAVIRGTSTNQDGRTPSISQPSSAAQTALIRTASESGGIDFSSTGYFEAHVSIASNTATIHPFLVNFFLLMGGHLIGTCHSDDQEKCESPNEIMTMKNAKILLRSGNRDRRW